MIGVLDSGIGGLLGVREIIGAFNDMDVIYVGDTAHYPFGHKSREAVQKFSLACLDFLLAQRIRILVITCQHISSAAKDLIAQRTTAPIVDVMAATAKLALAGDKRSAIGVIEDRAGVSAPDVYEEFTRAAPKATVYQAACPLLAPIIAAGRQNKPEGVKIIKNCLRPLKTRQVDTLILGATVFSVIREQIQHKIGKRVRVIDPSAALRLELLQFLETHPELKPIVQGTGMQKFYVTDLTPEIAETARRFFRGNIKLELIGI